MESNRIALFLDNFACSMGYGLGSTIGAGVGAAVVAGTYQLYSLVGFSWIAIGVGVLFGTYGLYQYYKVILITK